MIWWDFFSLERRKSEAFESGGAKTKKVQRTLSKRKGSSNRQKAKGKINQIHERLAFKPEDFLHQTSASLIKRVSFIATEDLNVKDMAFPGGSFKADLIVRSSTHLLESYF